MRYMNTLCICTMIIDEVKQKYTKGNLSQYHTDHNKFHVRWPWIETRPPRKCRRLTALLFFSVIDPVIVYNCVLDLTWYMQW